VAQVKQRGFANVVFHLMCHFCLLSICFLYARLVRLFYFCNNVDKKSSLMFVNGQKCL